MSTAPKRWKTAPSLPPPVTPYCTGMLFSRASRITRWTYSRGVMLELSTARITNPLPISESAKRFDSSSECQLTNVSIAKTKSGVFPSFAMRSAPARQANFFSGEPHKRDVAPRQIKTERPDCFNQYRTAHAIVKATGVRARTKQRAILLRDGDPIACLDAELLRFFRRARTHINMRWLVESSRAVRPLETRPVPTLRQFQHAAGSRSVALMNQHDVPQKILRVAAAKHIHEQPAVRLKGPHLITNLIHVRDEENFRCLRFGLSVAKMQDQIAGSIDSGLHLLFWRVLRIQPSLDFLAHGVFVPASSVRLDEIWE